MKTKSTISIIIAIIISLSSIFLLGFKLTTNKTPQEVYNVYLDGEKIGTVKSKKDFESYGGAIALDLGFDICHLIRFPLIFAGLILAVRLRKSNNFLYFFALRSRISLANSLTQPSTP